MNSTLNQSKGKILIHSLVFSPDGVSTAYLYNDIALRLKASGYEVVVLTTTPHYNIVEEDVAKQPLKSKLLGLYYKSNFNGIEVIHIPQKKFKSTLLRLIGFVYWHLISFFIGFSIRNVSLILSPSPPLTIGLVSLILAKMKGAKVVYNVQEIYPDFLINVGGLKSKPAIFFLKLMERTIYNFSDKVTTIDQFFYETIIPRFKREKDLHIIPNFVDTDLFRPISDDEITLDRIIFPLKPNVLKLMYAGNIGLAQDWLPLIDIAKQLVEKPVEFWVVGEGVMKDKLIDLITKEGLNNIHIVPYQNRKHMPSLIAYADVHFIFMTPEMDTQGFPSKVYSIMACGKPMLIITRNQTPLHNFLKDIDVAFLITESNHQVKCKQAINSIDLALSDKNKLKLMGDSGTGLILEKYSKKAVTGKYADLIRLLLN